MLTNYFFLFFILIILCSLMVIISRNPIQSVYFLILVFALTSVLFIILGADFLAILLVIVYVGAVSILFLFVVMMLNLRIVELYSTFYSHLPIGGFIGLFFIFEIIFALNFDISFLKSNNFLNEDFFSVWINNINYKSNIHYLGFILYNFYNHLVLIASLILLVSMIGSIVLTVDFDYRGDRLKKEYAYVKRPVDHVSFWRVKK